MKSILILVNDAPYGTEKAYNAMRLAMQLQKEHDQVEVRMFLMADAVTCAIPNQNTPSGYYNIERMLKSIIMKGGIVKLCGSCADARGLKSIPLIAGAELSTMSQFTQWTVDSDKVVTF
ncbi:MAG: DsrE family protein [Bacteroidales bacterium]|nr:DsrE family protein [Bacteroidales bacterium]